MKKSTDSWNKIRDLRHTLIQYLSQQNRFEREKMRLLKEKKMLDDMLEASPC